MNARSLLVTAAAIVVLAGCRGPDDQRTDTITDRDIQAAREQLDPAVAEALDRGNAAFREREYEQALELYTAAVEMDESVAAGWFGIYMAQLALGNAEAAEAAMVQARIHAPTASLIQPDDDVPVPATHPALRDTQP